MRWFAATFAIVLAIGVRLSTAQSENGQTLVPFIELQSDALTPPVVVEESPRPVHQVRLVVDASLKRGNLILDGNRPEFDDFGKLIGGLQTPHVRASSLDSLRREIPCTIRMVKHGSDEWQLYRLEGPSLKTPFQVATRNNISEGGPARLMILGPDQKPAIVIHCTRYGLVLP